MEDFHSASAKAGLVELELGENVISVKVGGEVKSDDDG
jgi:hypothetical protein